MDVLVESLLLAVLDLPFHNVCVLVALYFLEVAVHNFSVEFFRLSDLVLVSFKSLLPGDVLSGIHILDNSRVVLWGYVAAIVEGFDSTGEEGSVPDEAVLSQVDVTVSDWANG